MAVLSDNNRAAVCSQLQEECSNIREALSGVTKADLRAAVNAADAWAESNAAEYNSAIPQPARGALTAKQKARLLYLVSLKRLGVL